MTEEVQTQEAVQEAEFNFTLTEQQANIVLAGLSKLPYEIVASLISKMQEQFAQQTKVV